MQSNPPLNHYCEISSGVLEVECLELIQTFFRNARKEAKRRKLEAKLRAMEAEEEGQENPEGREC